MGLFAGMTAGWGQAQGQHNQKIMDFLNQKSQTMAQLYGHLADNAEDQDTAQEFMNRAANWAQANPLIDPKGYRELVKAEKGGLHDIVDRVHQRNIANYQQQQFGVQPPQTAPTPQGGQPGSQGATAAPTTPSPISQPPATAAPFTGKEFSPGMEPASASSTLAPPTPASTVQATDTAMPPQGFQANMPAGGVPPIPQGPPMPTGTPPMSIQDYVKGIVGPEPPHYGAMGRETPEHKMWADAYLKRLEGTIPTPASMQQAIGGPFMPAGFASPYLSYMGREAYANSRLAGNGYKMVNGQIIPMNPDEYSMAANLKMQKDQMSAELQAASIPLRQALTNYYGTKTQMIPTEMKIKLQELGVRVAHLRLSEEMTNARLFSLGPDGKPLPGSLVIDGTPVSPMLSSNVRPTGQTLSRAETAIPVMQQIDSLDQFTKTNPDLFDIVQGNLTDWLASGKNMTKDPREGELRASIISLASLMVPLHGFRSQKAAEEFMGRLSQGMTPDGFISALRGFNAVGTNIYENGMPQIIGGQGQIRPKLYKPGTTPTVTQPKFTIGQSFTKGGKKYKVTKINADGGVDAVEVP